MRLLAATVGLLFLCGACGSPPEAKAPPQPHWSKLTIEWSYGPCDPNGAKSCHQLLRVTPDGNATTEESAPDPRNPTITKSTNLGVEEQSWLEKIVGSTDFRRGMDDGFGCPESQDARIVIHFESGSSKQDREVAQCVSDKAANPAKSLVTLLLPYRYATTIP